MAILLSIKKKKTQFTNVASVFPMNLKTLSKVAEQNSGVSRKMKGHVRLFGVQTKCKTKQRERKRESGVWFGFWRLSHNTTQHILDSGNRCFFRGCLGGF